MKNANNCGVVFFGTGSFAVPILEKLASSAFRPVLVVTSPDAPKGRRAVLTPPPVKIAAEGLGLDVYQPISLKAEEAIQRIKSVEPTVGVSAAYGKIIPKRILNIFPKGILNVHPSLLPRWRGPTPIQAAILAGDEKTGVTIILMDEEIDHGPILAKRELPITNNQLLKPDYPVLSQKLAEIGAELIVDILQKWLWGALSPAPQNHDAATFCHKFTREDAKIDWSKPAEEINRMVRALNPEPGTWTSYQTTNSKLQIMKILAVTIPQHSQVCKDVVAGGVFEYEKKLAVKCGNGVLILDIVQPEGKKPMPGEAFLCGHPEIIGQILG